MNEKEKIRITGYTGSEGKEYIVLHIKKFRLLMENFVAPNLNLLKKIGIILDFCICVVLYGAGINDYFQYNFYRRKHSDRKNFIVGRKWKKIIRVCNKKINQKEFDDKCKFNYIYSEYLGREWLDMDSCEFDAFDEFMKKHSVAISKIKNGSGGNGINIIKYEKEDNEILYKKLKKQHVIVEEVLTQCDELKKFNPESVNTLRVVTIVVDNTDVRIMNAVMRMGNGKKCTDNFHHHGLAALVDEKTGIIVTPAIDKSNNQYYYHPRTGYQIIGYQIPNWESIIETVKSAALVKPEIRYVGWDIALDKNGKVCIIEGNCASDPDITQMPDQIGKWPKYNKVLKELDKQE